MLTYSLLACDMDGTLLGDDASICQRNIRVIRQAMARRAALRSLHRPWF